VSTLTSARLQAMATARGLELGPEEARRLRPMVQDLLAAAEHLRRDAPANAVERNPQAGPKTSAWR
jgi:hypothetical protein